MEDVVLLFPSQDHVKEVKSFSLLWLQELALLKNSESTREGRGVLGFSPRIPLEVCKGNGQRQDNGKRLQKAEH
eukprot:3025112-Amphidinium_carterae.1